MLLHLNEYANSTQIFAWDSSGPIKTEIFDAIFAVRSAEDSNESTNLMSAAFDTDLEAQSSEVGNSTDL